MVVLKYITIYVIPIKTVNCFGFRGQKTIDEWCTQRDANLHLTTVASMPTSLRQPTDGRLPREEKKVDTADVNSGSGDGKS